MVIVDQSADYVLGAVFTEVCRRYDRDGPVCDQGEVCPSNLRPLRRVALFFQPLFLQICLFVFRARGIADRLHAGDIGMCAYRRWCCRYRAAA